MNKHTHLIGIGGIGMSCIASLLLRRGVKVSGSDVKESRITRELKKMGADVFLGHASVNIENADLVVYSSAVKDDNPEVIEAKKRGVPVIKRAEALAQLMAEKTAITVTGSHGKTTTTSLISCLLLEAGLNPSVAVGGILRNIDTNACFGDGDYFVAEADESDGSFLCYEPTYSIITNIDYEHLDYYRDYQNLIDSFTEFLNKTKEGGCAFCCNDDLALMNIVKEYTKRRILFGLTDSADIYPSNVQINGLSSRFDCYYKKKLIDSFYLPLGGTHNISNSLAVIALGLELGIDVDIIKRTLSNFKGAGRRIEIKYNHDDYLVIDDYAHHPTEIKATLAAVRNLKAKRVVAVFQPHRFTRTQLLLDEFAKCFDLADYVVITDIYAASEPPIPGISGQTIYEKVKERSPQKEVVFIPKGGIVMHVLEILKPGDVVVTLGAGDITKIGDELVEKLKG